MHFFFFLRKYSWKILGFDRMYKNKIFFSFSFLKREIKLKVLRFFFNSFGENQVFNTGYISYSVSIRSDIIQNW